MSDQKFDLRTHFATNWSTYASFAVGLGQTAIVAQITYTYGVLGNSVASRLPSVSALGTTMNALATRQDFSTMLERMTAHLEHREAA